MLVQLFKQLILTAEAGLLLHSIKVSRLKHMRMTYASILS